MSRAIELLALHIGECLPYLWRDADLTGNDAAEALSAIGTDAVADILPLHPSSPAVIAAAAHVASLDLYEMSGHDIVMAVLDAVRAGLK